MKYIVSALLYAVLVIMVGVLIVGTDTEAADPTERPGKERDMSDKVEKSNEEWRRELTEEQYRVTREGGTEPAFTGKYYRHKESGTYRCVCCDNVLFQSDTKYESGSGWPSFWQPADSQAVERETDLTFGMLRTEIKCSRCGAHLGHVFEDGPQPTGQRYCVNSAALKFDPDSGKGDDK